MAINMIRKYLSFFKIQFTVQLQYRAAAWAGVSTQFAWGFLEILMFAAFYRASPENFPMTFSQLSDYIWLQQAFLAIFMTWFWNMDTFASIENGNISYQLCRPADLYAMWFTGDAARRISRAFLRCVPILAVSLLLPYPYNLGAPASAAAFLLFVISMILGLLVVLSFCMLIYIACFYTMHGAGLRMIAMTAAEVFTGAIMPIPFLPKALQDILKFLPFASMNNAPLRIYPGHIAGTDAVFTVLMQLFWFLVLLILGRVLMKRALRRVVIQGA